MSLAKDNLIQARNLLEQAIIFLGQAQSLVGHAQTLDVTPNTSPDANYSTWATLSTAIGTAITNSKTAMGELYYYPTQPSSGGPYTDVPAADPAPYPSGM